MTKIYTPYQVARKVLEKQLELELKKAEKNSAHVVEEGKKVVEGRLKKKKFGSEEEGESQEHENNESPEEEKQEHSEGSEESKESESHEANESPKKEESEHKEEQPKKKMNFFAKKPEMQKSEETKIKHSKSPILDFLQKKEDKAKSKERGVHMADPKFGVPMSRMALETGNEFGAKEEHKDKLKELKSMKKPSLPKSEDCNEAEDEGAEMKKTALRRRGPTKLKVALKPKVMKKG